MTWMNVNVHGQDRTVKMVSPKYVQERFCKRLACGLLKSHGQDMAGNNITGGTRLSERSLQAPSTRKPVLPALIDLVSKPSSAPGLWSAQGEMKMMEGRGDVMDGCWQHSLTGLLEAIKVWQKRDEKASGVPITSLFTVCFLQYHGLATLWVASGTKSIQKYKTNHSVGTQDGALSTSAQQISKIFFFLF